MIIRELWFNLLFLGFITHAIIGNIPRIEGVGIEFNDNIHNKKQISVSEETDGNRWHGLDTHQQINNDENNHESGNYPGNSLVHTNTGSTGESGFFNNQQNQNDDWPERHVQENGHFINQDVQPAVRPVGMTNNEQKDFGETNQRAIEDTNIFKDVVMKDIHISEWNPMQDGIALVTHEIKDSQWNDPQQNTFLTDLVNSNINSEWNNHKTGESLPSVGINEERDTGLLSKGNEQHAVDGLRDIDFKNDEQNYIKDLQNRQPATNDQDRRNQINDDARSINNEGRGNFQPESRGPIEEKNVEHGRQITKENWNIDEDAKTANVEHLSQNNFSDRRYDSAERRNPESDVPNTRDSWFTSNEFQNERSWVKDNSFQQNEEHWEGNGKEKNHNFEANTQKTDPNWNTNTEQTKDREPTEFTLNRGVDKPHDKDSGNIEGDFNINDQLNNGQNVFIEFTQSSPGKIDENGILHIDMSSLKPQDGHFQTTDYTSTRLLEENLGRNIISSLAGQFEQPDSAGENVFSVNEAKLTRGDTARMVPDFRTRIPQGNYKGGYESSYTGNNYGESSHENSIPGVIGQDYPNYSSIPVTEFDCRKQNNPGYFADMEAGCQVYHICQSDGRHDSFLCPTGTIFNQKLFTCDWWYNYDCSSSSEFYSLNFMLYRAADAQGNYKGSYYTRNTVGSVFPSQALPISNIPFENGNAINRDKIPVNEYVQSEENLNENVPFKENNFGYKVDEGNLIKSRGDASYFPVEEVKNSWIDLNNVQEVNVPRNEGLDDAHFYNSENTQEGFNARAKNDGRHQNTEEVTLNIDNSKVWFPNEALSQVNGRNIGINYGESNDNFLSTKRKDDDVIVNNNEQKWDSQSKLTKESEINEKNKVFINNNMIPKTDAQDNESDGGYTKNQNVEKSAKTSRERGNVWRNDANEKPITDISKAIERTELPWQSGESYKDFQIEGRNSDFFNGGNVNSDENNSNKNLEGVPVESTVHGENKSGREIYNSGNHRDWDQQKGYEAEDRSVATTKEDIDRKRNEFRLAQGNDDRTVNSVSPENTFRVPAIRNEERAVFEDKDTHSKPDQADRQRMNTEGEYRFGGNINDFVQDGQYFILMRSDIDGFTPEMLDTVNGGMTVILQENENSHNERKNENAPMSVIPITSETERTRPEENKENSKFYEDQKVRDRDSRNFPLREEMLSGRRDPRLRENVFEEGTTDGGGGHRETGVLQKRENHQIIDNTREKPSEPGFIPREDVHWKTVDEKIVPITGHEEISDRRYEDPYFRPNNGWENHDEHGEKYLSENYGLQEGSEVHQVNVSIKEMVTKHQPKYGLNEEKTENADQLLSDGRKRIVEHEENSNDFNLNFVIPELKLKADELETSPKTNSSLVIETKEEDKKSLVENAPMSPSVTDIPLHDTMEPENLNLTNSNIPSNTNEKKKFIKYIDFSKVFSGDLKDKTGDNKNYDSLTELDSSLRNKGIKHLTTVVSLPRLAVSEEGKTVKNMLSRFNISKNIQNPRIKIVRKRKNGQIVSFESSFERPTA